MRKHYSDLGRPEASRPERKVMRQALRIGVSRPFLNYTLGRVVGEKKCPSVKGK